MNSIQKFGAWIFNLKPQTERVIPLNEELVRKDHQVKALTQKVMAREAQIAKIIANEREKQENAVKEDKEQELIARIQEQALDIKQEKQGKPTSLKKFFGMYFNDKKFRESLEITDADGGTIFGKFGDLLIMPDRTMVITDSENNVISAGRSINQLIFKPETLLNQLKRNMIAIPRDRDGKRLVDIGDEEVPKIIFDENADVPERDENGQIVLDENGNQKMIKGAYRETQEKLIRVREVMIEYEEKVRELTSYIERLEQVREKITNENSDLKRSLSTYKNSSDVRQSELSLAMSKTMQFEQRFADLARENAKLLELKATNETIIEKLKSIQSEVFDKANKMETNSSMELAEAKMKDLMDYAYSRTPSTITNMIQPETKQNPVVNPGQILKQGGS